MAEVLQQACVKFLLNTPEVVNAVGSFPDSHKPFLFRDEMLVNLEDSQYSAVSAVVIEDGGPLAVLHLGRYRARRLRVNIWANGTRDMLGNLVDSKSVRNKIEDTFQILDKYLHRPNPETIYWSTIPTVFSERLIDLSEPVAVTDGDGIMLATAYYAVGF